MSMRNKVIVLGVLLATSSCVGPGDMSLLTPRQDLLGAWTGLSGDDVYYLRVQLQKAGAGDIAVVFLHDESCAFRIERWDYENGQVVFNTVPMSEDHLEVTFKGTVLSDRRISLRMIGDDWHTTCLLRKESDVQRRDQIARDSLRVNK